MNKKTLSSEEILILSFPNGDKPSNADRELLEVFDDKDKPSGFAPRFLCHRLGLLHQVGYVLVSNVQGQLLLQTRGDLPSKRLDVAVGGHISSEDKFPLNAVIREMMEELGFKPKEEKLQLITTYKRVNLENPKKPKELNREIRHVYVYRLDDTEENNLNENFSKRLEKLSVLDIGWFDVKDVIKACDEDRVADGLKATIAHYLLWKYNSS